MSERTAVQDPLLSYASAIGWEHLPPDEALRLRGGDGGRFFVDVLEAQLLRLNPGVVTPARAAEIIRRLNNIPATMAGNRDALAWMRGEQSVFVEDENRERQVKLIDFDHPEKNQFHVSAEWWQRGAVHRNRADAVLLINGIPVAVAETKGATKRSGLEEGVEQVRRYHRETPDLFVASQVFEVTQMMGFFYGATWATSRKGLFNWKEELAEAEGGPADYERKVKAFFDRPRFLKVLRDYIIFLTKDDNLSKVILRQHQTRAVEKVIDRVADAHKRRGLVWHTQGSGKTLTMITIASRLLRETRGTAKPTVLMLVDRNELEQQLFRNIEAYGIGTVEVAQSKKDLQQILGSDYRGLVVSMIHKFDDVPPNLNTRDGVVVLVDEAHRTTGGDLGNYLLAAIPNATYIGFTGTPIDKLSHGKGTFKVFGGDDERGYLDKYSIAESIEDGTTVALNYALAPSGLLVDRDKLERDFLMVAEAQGVSDVEEVNAILDRAVELKEMMKARQRVDQVAAFVAKHFRENVEPLGFKAFLVGVDREACALYKKALDKYLPPEYSRVVYSPGTNDKPPITDYQIDEDDEKRLRREFLLKDTLPKILIVTEKLLTGFDAPVLYAMYLDKPMRDHVLLQAIARVNRPYEDDDGLVKPYGFVLDFVGIFDNLEKALAFDSDVVGSVIQNIDVLKKLFAAYMEGEARQYIVLKPGWDDRAADAAIVRFENKDKREAFYKFYRRLQNLYDIISPDAFLRPFIDDYRAIAELYGLLRTAYGNTYVDRELTGKTRELLRTSTQTSAIQPPGAIHKLGPAELAALKRGGESDTVKVLNLRKVLAESVVREGTSKPFLIPIGERAEALAERYEDRQVTTQQALLEFERLAQEAVDATAEQRRLGVDENTYAILIALRPVADGASIEHATRINELFAQYPDYQWNEQQRSALRLALYKALRPVVGAGKMIDVANLILRLQRTA